MLDGRGGSGRSGVGGEYLSVMGGARGAFIAWVDEGGAEDLGAKVQGSGWMVSFVAAVPTTRIPSLAKFLITRWLLRFYLCPSFPVAIAFPPYLTLLFARVVFIYPQAIR